MLGAVLAMLGLLLALGAVVQQVVRQAALHHAHVAARAQVLWRCNLQPDRTERATCRQRADAEPAELLAARP